MSTYSFKPSNFIKKQPSYKLNIRFILYTFLIVAATITIFIWQKKLIKIKSDSKNELAQINEIALQNLKNGLEKTDKNYAELMLLGKKYLDKNELSLALLYFEKVSKDEPDYRDAAFYTGYVYLKLSENNNSKNTFVLQLSSDVSLQNSLDNFLKAKSIDSLYAPTYEFLAYVYKQLGDDKNAEVCYNRFKELST